MFHALNLSVFQNVAHRTADIGGTVRKFVESFHRGNAGQHKNGVHRRLNSRDDVGVHTVADYGGVGRMAAEQLRPVLIMRGLGFPRK